MVLLDALMAVVWMTVTLLLCRTSWRLASALSSGHLFVDRLVDALVNGLSMVVAGAILLGMLGHLSGAPLLFVVASLAGTGELLTRRILARQSDALARGASADAVRTDAILPPSETRPGTNWFAIVWGVLLAWLISHMIVDGLLKFPTDWDCLMYHIPMVDEWLQAGSLYAPDSPYWWSPGNSEVIGLWCVAPFSGDFLIALNNLPVMVLWVASTLSVARSLGMSNAGSHLTAIAVVLVHTSFHETDDASNDLLLVAAFTAAVAYLLRNLRQPRKAEVVLGGLSLGLLAGVKYFSVGYVALIVGAWGVTSLLQGKRWNVWREMALLLALAVPCGAYWYVRNVVVSGAPCYPMGLSGESPAVGYPNVGTTSLWGNPDPSRWGLVLPSLWKMTGPIHLVAVIMSPTVMVGLGTAGFWLAPEDRRSAFKRCRWPLLAALMAGCGMLILITPFAVEDQPGTLNHLRWAYTPVRYGLPFLSLAVVGLGMEMNLILSEVDRRKRVCVTAARDATGRWRGRLSMASALVVLIWQTVLRLEYAAIELDIGDSLLLAFWFCLFSVNWMIIITRPLTTDYRTVAALVGICAGAFPATVLSHQWHSGFDSHYDRFFQTTMFSDLTRDYADANRICVLDLRHYAFFGSARERHVCRPRILASIDALYAYLDHRAIVYVAATNSRGQVFDLYGESPRWLRSNPKRFHVQLTAGMHTLFVYRPKSDARSVFEQWAGTLVLTDMHANCSRPRDRTICRGVGNERKN